MVYDAAALLYQYWYNNGLDAATACAGFDTRRVVMVLLGVSPEAIMSDMGTFRISVELENPAKPGERRGVSGVLIDTGAELSWFPAATLEALGIERFEKWRFRQVNGNVIERWVGPAFVHAVGKRATDDVVFGEPGDLILLGARTLEGLNLRIEPTTRQLVDAGPAPAATAADGRQNPSRARPRMGRAIA